MSDERGEALVEFALVAPILVLILVSILELGRVVDAWLVVHNAAREGARAGAVVSPLDEPSDPAVAAEQAAARYLDATIGTRGDVAGTLVAPVVTTEAVAVTTEAQVRLYTPLARRLVAETVPVRASAVMRRQ
jgi:Flp pilus assembly protein TadG